MIGLIKIIAQKKPLAQKLADFSSNGLKFIRTQANIPIRTCYANLIDFNFKSHAV
jgi:hypothetical protein